MSSLRQRSAPQSAGAHAAAPHSPAMAIAPVFDNVLEMIGNTPMLRIKRLDTGPCELFVKMESANPGNSIKKTQACLK
jgi:hypothetical protein